MFDRRAFLALSASLATLAASRLPAQARPSVVATTGMIGDAVTVLAGDMVELKTLMGPGIDPHAYRTTRTDILALTRADLVLWHGLYLEAQMEEFLLKLASRSTVVAVADSLPQDRLLTHETYAGRADPHVWMDPTLWRDVVTTIEERLIALLPEHGAAIAERGAVYRDEIAALDIYSREILDSVPEPARVLLTAHDAFRYFGEAYGYEVLGIQGISTESEAGLARISDLVDMLVERDIGAAFVETSVSDRNVRALAEGVAARGGSLSIGGALFSDAMGTSGSYEGTYLGMIDHNVTTIAAALGGAAPARGRLGLLSAGI